MVAAAVADCNLPSLYFQQSNLPYSLIINFAFLSTVLHFLKEDRPVLTPIFGPPDTGAAHHATAIRLDHFGLCQSATSALFVGLARVLQMYSFTQIMSEKPQYQEQIHKFKRSRVVDASGQPMPYRPSPVRHGHGMCP